MAKSGFVVGGIAGAAVMFFALFILFPSEDIVTSDLITSNGHDLTILGDETTLSSKKNLTLVELFEKSEEGVVKIRADSIDSFTDTGGVGSGFVYDILGHIIMIEPIKHKLWCKI